MRGHRARDSRQISSLGCTEPETLTFHHGGAQSLRLSANVTIPCTEPETLGSFHARGAQSLRLSAIFIVRGRRASDSPQFLGGGHRAPDGQQISSWMFTEPETFRHLHEREYRQPETVGTFHHGRAQSPRRSAVCMRGSANSLRLFSNFITGLHRARDVPQFL